MVSDMQRSTLLSSWIRTGAMLAALAIAGCGGGGSDDTILVPPGDAPALAAGVQRALSLDESALAHMASAGRGRVRQRFSLEAMTGATLEVYRRAAAQAARRG